MWAKHDTIYGGVAKWHSKKKTKDGGSRNTFLVAVMDQEDRFHFRSVDRLL